MRMHTCIPSCSARPAACLRRSPDLEIAGRRYSYLVLRERMPPEVEGDVDDNVRSPRDRM